MKTFKNGKRYVPKAARVVGCQCDRTKLFTLAGFKLHLPRCPIDTQHSVPGMRAHQQGHQ